MSLCPLRLCVEITFLIGHRQLNTEDTETQSESDLLIVRTRARPWAGTLSSSHSKVVVIQRGIKQQEKFSLGLMPPHRVCCKHYDVSTTNGNIYNCRFIH